MASGGKVEIQVELEGGDKVQGALNKIGRGAELAGGKVAQAGEALSSSSNIMTASLGGVVSSIGTLTQGVGGLTTATRTAGAGFTAMLGPIAAIGTAIYAVVQAVRQYIRNSQDLETRMEALKAAASEYTSAMERLSDENIILTDEERRRLASLTRIAKAQAEYIQKIREGEGIEGQRLQRAQRAFAQAQADVDLIRKRTVTEAYFLEQSIKQRARLKVATLTLEEAEAKLDAREKEAMRNRRALAEFQEKIIEQRGRSALEKQQAAAAKATQDAASALQSIQNMQLRFNIEAITATGASVSERVAILRVELAERKRLIGQSIADEQERLTAIAAAEQAFNAKRRALYKQGAEQRAAARAQEEAARKAAADQAFADEQRLAQARIMLTTKGLEQQRQLIELRFQAAQRAASNETQLETARLNRQREMMMLEEKQEADRRAAEMKRIEALQRSIELTRQEAAALQQLSSVDMTKITAAVENFGQGLVYASLAALQSGESVSVAVGEALKAIALQAGVEAIMQTAKGTAALFTPGGQLEAAGHFKAAGFFGAAAVAAGAAGSALSSSGGGGGGGGGVSPSGATQSIRDREFDREEDRAGVTINVNMGQAVIYDTKAAAERAFADRVVQAINTPRRGAVRLRGA
jgi:hypothetical protein